MDSHFKNFFSNQQRCFNHEKCNSIILSAFLPADETNETDLLFESNILFVIVPKENQGRYQAIFKKKIENSLRKRGINRRFRSDFATELETRIRGVNSQFVKGVWNVGRACVHAAATKRK